MLLAIHPLPSILCVTIRIFIDSKTISQVIFKLSFIGISITVNHSSFNKLIVLPSSFKNISIAHFQYTFTMLFILFPLSYILAIGANICTLPLLHVIYPLALVKGILKIEVFSKALLTTIYPLSFIY